MLEPPFVIENRYYVNSKIGAGGFATVFLAHDSVLNIPVAVKILKEPVVKDSPQYQRYIREIQTICTVSSKNIIKVYDVGFYNDHAYIVMEFVKGITARELLRKRGKLTIPEAYDILSQICDALIEVHKYKIIHRDIKPQNIVVKNDGQVVLLDFGTAIIYTKYDGSITGEHSIVCSPTYLDPEVAQSGGKYTEQSDIYSVGITMFELLNGKPPFIASEALAVLAAHRLQPLPRIHKLNKKIPKSFEKIINKACAKTFDTRYLTVVEFKDDLDKAYAKYKKRYKIK